MRICYQAIEGFRSRTLRVWREDKPEVVVSTLAVHDGMGLLLTTRAPEGFACDVVTHTDPREAGEWVENWLRTYDS